MTYSLFNDTNINETTLTNKFEDFKKHILKQKLTGNLDFNTDEFLTLYHTGDSVIFFSEYSLIQFRIIVKGALSYLRIDSTNPNLAITGSRYIKRHLGGAYIVSDEYYANIQLGVDTRIIEHNSYVEYDNVIYTSLPFSSILGASSYGKSKEARVIMSYSNQDACIYDTVPFAVRMKNGIFTELQYVELVKRLKFVENER